jgi:hypothetical protein
LREELRMSMCGSGLVRPARRSQLKAMRRRARSALTVVELEISGRLGDINDIH